MNGTAEDDTETTQNKRTQKDTETQHKSKENT